MSIDYAKANRQFRAQKAALTRAINSKDPEKVIAAATKAVKEWEEVGSWPDSWHRWNIALSDAFTQAYVNYRDGKTDVKPDASRFDLDAIRTQVVLG